MGKICADISVYQFTTLPTDVTNLLLQYEGSGVANPEPDLVTQIPSAQDSSRQSITVVETSLQQLAAATVERMVFRDNAQSSRTNVLVNLNEVIRQMLASSNTVQSCAVTIATAAIAGYANNGNGILVATTKRGDGRQQENLFAEVARIACTGDAQSGGAIAGNETFQFQGTEAQPNVFHWEWPLGSGANASLQACSALANNSGGNLLTNSGFDTFTVNTPNNWTVLVGTPGTDFAKDTGTVYTGAADLKFIGGTAVNSSLVQQFNLAAGTLGKVAPDGQYAHALWIKADVVPASGVLTVDLIDQGATTINDDQGIANSYTVALSTITTSYAAYSGVFRLPKVLPTSVRIRYRISTVIPGGTNVFLDHTSLTPITKLYLGGPSLSVFSGSVPWIIGDKFSVTTTNDRGGSTNLKTFQTLFDRCFNMKQFELLLPSSGSPTVADSLIF
jgi:hypothetical protein